MRPDGSHRYRILRNKQNAKRPRLSPNHTWVAFDGAPPGKAPMTDFDIQIVHLDGTGLRTLTTSADWDVDAEWAPDGRRLSFTRMLAGAVWRRSWIWTIGREGQGLRRLTRGQNARWSPGGRQLVIDAPSMGSASDLFIVNADGTGRRRLTAAPGYKMPAAWSPDGTMILFTLWPQETTSYVCVMKADGTAVRRLAEGIAGDWSPDGAQILYTSPALGLALMAVDGSHKHSLWSGDVADPSWR
jgi:TolB protein